MAAPKKGTKKKILDCAEKIFAQSGYENSSIRTIAARANCTVGSIGYHFGSKSNLFACVTQRRFETVMEARRLAYHRIMAETNGDVTLDHVITCIVQPVLHYSFCGDSGWRSYIRILSYTISDKKLYKLALAESSESAAHEFIDWIKSAAPDANDVDIGYGYQFMIGAMIQCCTDIYVNRVAAITDGRCDSANFEEIEGRILSFICAGFRAVLKQ